jgi:hypothetical protein
MYDWYVCPNCQYAACYTDSEVCLECGRLLSLDEYPHDAEALYQRGEE